MFFSTGKLDSGARALHSCSLKLMMPLRQNGLWDTLRAGEQLAVCYKLLVTDQSVKAMMPLLAEQQSGVWSHCTVSLVFLLHLSCLGVTSMIQGAIRKHTHTRQLLAKHYNYYDGSALTCSLNTHMLAASLLFQVLVCQRPSSLNGNPKLLFLLFFCHLHLGLLVSVLC